MTFPTPHTVLWHTADMSGEDAHGNPTTTYTPDLDEDGEATPVIFIAPGGSSEPNEVRVEHDLEIGLPPDSSKGGPQDVVDVPNVGRFQVVGWPDDYTLGPFGFRPGKIVKLTRVQS